MREKAKPIFSTVYLYSCHQRDAGGSGEIIHLHDKYETRPTQTHHHLLSD